jgi:hypothetical protein
MTLTRDSVVTAGDSHVGCEVSGEVFMLQLDDGVYYSLNAVGARIWELIQEPRSVAEIHHCLLGEYDVESERCEKDLFTLLSDLISKQLVDVRDGPAT